MKKIFASEAMKKWFFILVMAAYLVVCLTSCATKTKIEYRDREIEKLVVKEVHDTLREQVHDSTVIMEKGDTLLIEKWHTKYRDRIVERTDTCWRDSVVTEYKENVKEVTKIPKIYRYALVFSIIVIIFAFIKFIRWFQIH